MKICLASVATSSLLALATAGEQADLPQVKSDKLSGLRGTETNGGVPKWQREEKWKGDEEGGDLPKWKREEKWKGDRENGCSDPAGAVKDTLNCYGNKDAACVAAAYTPGFQLTHNELPPIQTVEYSEEFWTNAFLVLDFGFDVKFYNNPGPNLASVRYIQTVATFDGAGLPDGMGGTSPPNPEYPFSQTFFQHEHALVEVDDDCKLVKWDQYGDNKEQTDVAEASAALLAVLCEIGVIPCSPS